MQELNNPIGMDLFYKLRPGFAGKNVDPIDYSKRPKCNPNSFGIIYLSLQKFGFDDLNLIL
jgi:hypothetical protein